MVSEALGGSCPEVILSYLKEGKYQFTRKIQAMLESLEDIVIL